MNPERIKIWFDVLTPKEILFFGPMIQQLSKKNKVLVTTRDYSEINELAKIRGLRMRVVGKHGGGKLLGKLNASIDRMGELAGIVSRFRPDLVISFCSPDASRVAFGLNIRHVGFCNTPHATAVMRLTVPLLDRLLIPKYIPKREFKVFGMEPSNIIRYNAMDEYVIVKNTAKNPHPLKLRLTKNRTILFRTYETQAAYAGNTSFDTVSAVRTIADGFPEYNVVVLGRYPGQNRNLKRDLDGAAIVLDRMVDNGTILAIADVFVGSGGTMTTECALRGIPTISYEAIPSTIEKYLVRKGLVTRCSDYRKIPLAIRSVLEEDEKARLRRAAKFLDAMEDPYNTLESAIMSLPSN